MTVNTLMLVGVSEHRHSHEVWQEYKLAQPFRKALQQCIL